MTPHPAVTIFRAILEELVLSQPDWRAISLGDVKVRFVQKAIERWLVAG